MQKIRWGGIDFFLTLVKMGSEGREKAPYSCVIPIKPTLNVQSWEGYWPITFSALLTVPVNNLAVRVKFCPMSRLLSGASVTQLGIYLTCQFYHVSVYSPIPQGLRSHCQL